MSGAVLEIHTQQELRVVLAALQTIGEPVTPRQIHARTCLRYTPRQLLMILDRLCALGYARRHGPGVFSAVAETVSTPITPPAKRPKTMPKKTEKTPGLSVVPAQDEPTNTTALPPSMEAALQQLERKVKATTPEIRNAPLKVRALERLAPLMADDLRDLLLEIARDLQDVRACA